MYYEGRRALTAYSGVIKWVVEGAVLRLESMMNGPPAPSVDHHVQTPLRQPATHVEVTITGVRISTFEPPNIESLTQTFFASICPTGN